MATMGKVLIHLKKHETRAGPVACSGKTTWSVGGHWLKVLLDQAVHIDRSAIGAQG